MGSLALADWIKDIADYSVDVAGLVGGLAAALALAAGVRARYRRTLGRRRDRYERLARLGPGAQLSFFASVHGEPPAIRRTVDTEIFEVATQDHPLFDPALVDEDDEAHDVLVPASFVECIFIDRFYYLQTISDADDTVLAFSVTTRRKRFRPKFEAPHRIGLLERIRWRRRFGEPFRPLFSVRLGSTRFSDLDPVEPDDFAGPHFQATLGARTARYSELNYYGNPGHYLTYVFTASTAAPGRPEWGRLGEVIEQAGHHEWPYPSRTHEAPPPPPETEPEWDDLTAAHEFRRRTVITTYTAIGPGLWDVNFPVTFGPHGDEVRMLP
jgi:hypothetical protein